MISDWFSGVEKAIPGLLGSLGALLWIQGTWPRRIAMVALGSVASYYGAPYLATHTAINEGLAGFLVGLFGMAMVDSIFKTWADLGLSAILREAIRARLGLPPKG